MWKVLFTSSSDKVQLWCWKWWSFMNILCWCEDLIVWKYHSKVALKKSEIFSILFVKFYSAWLFLELLETLTYVIKSKNALENLILKH